MLAGLVWHPARLSRSAALIGRAEIDAADNRLGAVRHQNLAMIAIAEAERIERRDGIEIDHMDACLSQALEEVRRRCAGTVAVIDDVDCNACARFDSYG